jgi:hypothetical protein
MSNNISDVDDIPLEVLLDREKVAHLAMSGVRDPEKMRPTCERMDRMREEI